MGMVEYVRKYNVSYLIKEPAQHVEIATSEATTDILLVLRGWTEVFRSSSSRFIIYHTSQY